MKGESYALGSHDEKTNIEVARLLVGIFVKPETDIESVKDRPGNDLRYAVDYSKIKVRRMRWKDHPSLKLRRGKSGAVKPVMGW